MKKIISKLKKNLALSIGGGIVLVAVIASLAIVLINNDSGAKKVESRIMRYIESTWPGSTVSVKNVEKEPGIYMLYKLTIDDNGSDTTSYATRDGKFLFPIGYNLGDFTDESEQESKTTIGNFEKHSNDTCKQDGKPIVYFFGSETCPHCLWEHPIINKVAEIFGTEISYHDNMDTANEFDVFQQYSSGAIPTTVIGCQYSRIGSGENLGAEQNEKVLSALICSLTGNMPENVCEPLQELINQI